MPAALRAMVLLDFRQRTGWLFVAVLIGHIILISAQVTTRRGVPLLEEATFGVFAELADYFFVEHIACLSLVVLIRKGV